MKNLKNKSFFFIIAAIIYSCKPNPQICFHINNQEIKNCGGSSINELWLQNDSTVNGYYIEDEITVKWENKKIAPSTLFLNKIPEGYTVNGKRVEKINLMYNTSYSIINHSVYSSYYKIKIWTNNNGKVYKTSHTDCHKSQSL